MNAITAAAASHVPAASGLDALFNPASIAVIGASTDENSISGQPIRFLREHGYSGAVYAVNPKYDRVGGHACWPDVAALPAVPDVALVAVAARRVPETLQQLAARGVRRVIVLSSGFAEAGDEGAAAQVRVAQIAAETGMRVVGPNCQGMMNIDAGYALGFGAPFGLKFRRGGVSLTSQSGAFGNSVLMLADDEGVGFRHYVSTGNEAVTTTLDFVDHFVDDPGTRIIASYVEGFRDAARAVTVGRRALAAGKPWLMWKVGSSDAGAKAAASHTANLGGAPALYRAAFRQAGAIEVDDVGDLADCVQALQAGRLPRGPRIAVVTISGGAGILMADRCSDAGLTLPPLADATRDALRPLLPAFAALGNPIDLTADVLRTPEVFEQALRVIARDPNVDMIGLPLAAISGAPALVVARAVCALHRELDLPIMVAWNGPEATTREAYALLAEAGIPRYR
ncbi:MAG: CoA-binding protein, partial [Pseudomonadota bacterium]|nr:CoA-binding protein [Pseudomonadota bacterium]